MKSIYKSGIYFLLSASNHMRLSPAILFFIFFAFFAKGQSAKDSLRSMLDGADDSLQVELMIALSSEYSNRNSDSSLFFATEAETAAKRMGSPYLTAKSLNRKGVAFYFQNELENANEFYFEALTIFDSLHDIRGTARTLNNIGWNYKVQEQPYKAIEYFDKALKLAREDKDIVLTQGILNNIGTIYMNNDHYDSALDVFFESLDLNRQIGNEKWEAYNLNNIGRVMIEKNEYDEALKYFEAAGQLNSNNGFLEEYSKNLLNIGSIYVQMKNYEKAQYYFDLVYTKIIENDFQRLLLEYYKNMVELNIKRENFEDAYTYVVQKDSLDLILNRIEFNEKVGRLQSEFELAQKESDLREYQKKLTRQRMVIFGGTTVFLLLLSTLFLVLKLYKSKNTWAKNVEKLNDEIKDKADELNAINEQVNAVNNNLEKLVAERTEKIKIQNQKLVKYAFINSHDVRGPLARVLGLVNLLGLEKKTLNKEKAFKLLKNSAAELDEVVKSAGKILEDNEIFGEK